MKENKKLIREHRSIMFRYKHKTDYFNELLRINGIEFNNLSPHDIGIIKYYINLQYKTNFINYPHGLVQHLESL